MLLKNLKKRKYYINTERPMNKHTMNRLLLFSWIILMTSGLFAQSTISLKESSQNPLLDIYADYEAVILEDHGKLYFNYNGEGFDFVFERSTRFKINTSSGLDWTEVEIPLYKSSKNAEKLEKVSVSVLNEGESEEITYKKKDLDIYEEAYRAGMILKKFAVPNAKVGSIIEINYSYRSPYKYNLKDWIFQYSIPVLYSKFELTIVPFYEYATLRRGTSKLESFYHLDSKIEKPFGQTKYRERTYIWVMANIQAFDDESFIANRLDYIDRVEFQLRKINNTNGSSTDIMKDWPSVNKEMLENEKFGKYVAAARKQSKNIAGQYAKSRSEKDELINSIITYVKQEIKWNDYQSKFASKKVKKVLEAKEGNTADINLYLVGMLNAAGIEAYPLMLSTRAHGRIFNDSPMHASFNYVIACIPSETGYLLRDATEIAYPNDQLPVKCLNGQGLLVKKEGEKWVELVGDSFQSEINHSAYLNPQPDVSTINSIIEITSTGYDAIKHRDKVGNDPEEVEDLFGNDLISDIDSIQILSSTTQKDSFKVRIITELPLESIGDRMFIHPFAELPEKECPLNKKTRSYPVDMIYPKSRNFYSEIRIPEGYKASFVPEKYIFKNDLVTIKYIPVISENNILQIEAAMSFHKRIYPTTDYKKLQYFYKDMVKRLNEIIILERSVAIP